MMKNTSHQINILKITSESLKEKAYLDVFPEYYNLAKVTENSLWHNNQNVLDHVIGVFEGLEKVLKFESVPDLHRDLVERYLSEVLGNKTRREILIVATLLHDIGKAETLMQRPDGTAGCPGHELVGAAQVKNFAERFGLDSQAESYVERIVRYHGFIYQILELIVANGQKNKYLVIFKETVGDVALELVLLMRADLFGSDLEAGDEKAYKDRVNTLIWMFDELIAEQKI